MTDPCTPVTVEGADGARLVACAHGGHVLGWTPAGGRERLWVSPDAACGPGKAIRGGIPVVFPQFSDRALPDAEPLPKHGLARDRAWTQEEAGGGPGGPARWRASIADDEQTRAIWPRRFGLALTATASGPRLEVVLEVSNRDDQAWTFAAALHTYLAVGHEDTEISGLGGLPAEENAAPGSLKPLDDHPLPALEARDIAVHGVGGTVVLRDPVLGTVRMAGDGFTDRVVWNPGAGGRPADIPPGGEQQFVCVEPAILTAVRLGPGESWAARQVLEVDITDTQHGRATRRS